MEKKSLIIALALIVVMASFAFAASIPVQTFGTDPSYTETFTLLSLATNTTTGSVYKLGKPFKRVSCIVSNPSGSVPAGVSFSLSGGLDDASLVTLNTVSASTWPQIITSETSSSPYVTYVRGSIGTWTTNTGTTTLRMKCIAAH